MPEAKQDATRETPTAERREPDSADVLKWIPVVVPLSAVMLIVMVCIIVTAVL